MKRGIVFLALVALVTFFASGALADAPFHIGIMTGTLSQSEDDLRGAEKLIEMYGDVANGGMIKHVTYPDNFSSEMETVIAQLVGLADDPLMKVIVSVQGVPGTTEAYRKIRERRPDIILLIGMSQEDPNLTTQAADVVTDPDNVARGYLIVKAAQKLGAKTFVHISFPRHMSIELLSRRRAIMEEACKDLGMTYAFETAPDPTSDVGIPGAQQFILEKFPAWLDKYGKETAFFCTNDAQTEPLLKRVAEMGGFFIESDLPSPLLGYPGALGVDLSSVQGDWPAILKRVEDAVVAKGGAGRMGTWAFSFAYTTGVAMGELGKKLVEEGKTPEDFKNGNIDIKKEVLEAYGKFSPGAEWNASFYTDASTGVTMKNYPLLYQDTYIFGKGYLKMTDEVVPDKYFTVTGQ